MRSRLDRHAPSISHLVRSCALEDAPFVDRSVGGRTLGDQANAMPNLGILPTKRSAATVPE